MNSQEFSALSKYPERLSSADIQALTSLSESYPYSQIIFSLLAKAHRNGKTKAAKSMLTIAAIHTTDRQVLKNLMAKTVSSKDDEQSENKSTRTAESHNTISISPEVKRETNVPYAVDLLSSSMLREEVLTDLNTLRISKDNYMETLKDVEEADKTTAKNTSTTEAAPTRRKPTTSKKTTAPKKAAAPKKDKKKSATGKSRVSSSPSSKPKEEKDQPKAKATASKATSTKPKQPMAADSHEAETGNTAAAKSPASLKKKRTVNARVSKQQQIIDGFIDSEPNISTKPVLNVASEQKDLTENSTKLSDDLISENLAVILVDQGKTQKAIEMYKKLIWKFPQKKSYFAALIKELTK